MSNKQGNFKNQICVLRVNIHCDGCKKKIKKLLQKIEGVDATMIDADLGKVTVTGYVHPNVLIKKLVKSGKHAELWAAAKNNNNPFAAQNRAMNQFHDLQFEKLSKPQKGGKGFTKDLNMKAGPKAAPKTVQFDLPEDEFDESDGEFSESEDDEGGGGFDLDFGRRPPSRTPTRGGGGEGYGQHGAKDKKSFPNGHDKKGKSGGKKAKTGLIFRIRLLFKGLGRKKKAKNIIAGKKGKANGGAKGGCMKPGAIEFKNGGKNGGGWVLENGKNGNKGMPAAKNGGNNFKGGNNQTNAGKNGRGGGGKSADFQEIDFGNHRKGAGGGGGRGGGGGAGGGGYGGGGFAGGMGNYPAGQMGNNSFGPMGPMGNNSFGPMGPMGNNSFGPMGHYPAALSQIGGVDPTRQLGNYQAVQGMPAPAPINGGGFHHHQGMMMMGPTSHNHQYMGGNMNMMMMMNNQPPHAQLNGGMFHPTIYGRPPPMTGYAPHRASDGYSNMFNDENTESCSIM